MVMEEDMLGVKDRLWGKTNMILQYFVYNTCVGYMAYWVHLVCQSQPVCVSSVKHLVNRIIGRCCLL